MLEKLIMEGEAIKSSLKSSPGLYSLYYELDDTSTYECWKNNVIRYLSVKFKGDRCVEDFEKSIRFFEQEYTPSNFDALLGILKSCLKNPTIIPTKKTINKGSTQESKNSIVINNHNNNENNNTQNQNQILEIFLESITDEITGKQLKELKEITKIEPDPAKAKSKIIDKIKDFGENVITNIVANVITNPSIWSSLSNL